MLSVLAAGLGFSTAPNHESDSGLLCICGNYPLMALTEEMRSSENMETVHIMTFGADEFVMPNEGGVHNGDCATAEAHGFNVGEGHFMPVHTVHGYDCSGAKMGGHGDHMGGHGDHMGDM